MAKFKNTLSSLEDLKYALGSTIKEDSETSEDQFRDNENTEPDINKNLKIRIHLDRLPGSKLLSRISGIEASPQYMEQLCKNLKQKCGGGGSVRNGEILIQGDHVAKLLDYFIKLGFKNTKRSGG